LALSGGAPPGQGGSRIQRLPDDLVNKIQAGEVVERPASLVKELVENALDAGARTITVEIEGGGKTLVRVRDDGWGMSRADAELAVERHTTSKIHALGDLQAIATNGFRGEALASIASVSRLRLTTREEESAAGTEVVVEHGRLAHVRDAGHPRGTTVEVRELFAAVPARRKFLRSEATETAHVAEAVTLLALAHPEVGLRLVSRERALVEAPPAADCAARVYQLFGAELLARVFEIGQAVDWLAVSGFLGRPDRLPARATLRLFVNGRPVRDRAIAKAVSEAYRAVGVRDPQPEAILFLDLPRHLVDVNVHPTKSEVRFADARFVFDAVGRAVREALAALARGKTPASRAQGPEARTQRVAEAVQTYLAAPHHEAARFQAVTAAPGAAAEPAPRVESGAPPAALFEGTGPTVLGQHRNTYIVASDGEDLLLVDQHTAHERVRYEALLAGLERRAVASQGLLVPVVLALPPKLRPLVEAHAETLAALGFELDGFGGDSYRIVAMPAVLAGRDPGPALEGLLADLLERESGGWAVASGRERLVATVACHSSVKAGDPLGLPQMAAIVRDLAATRHPALCPHGRPTLVRIPREDVARWFGRAGWRRE
jgi:DNA mismatch repair protein MutL